MVRERQEVMLYSSEQVEMMRTTTIETTTLDYTTHYTGPLDESVQMKLRPLLQTCLSLGSGLLELAERDDILDERGMLKKENVQDVD